MISEKDELTFVVYEVLLLIFARFLTVVHLSINDSMLTSSYDYYKAIFVAMDGRGYQRPF